MEEELARLFPDQDITIRQYRSFINQPERILISSQEDVNDYDPDTVTSYYNFRVRLPRPALNVKSIQLARANLPNCVPNIQDTECTFWYYALPTVSAGNIYLNNAGNPGTLVYTFDSLGNIYSSPGGALVSGKVYFDSGVLDIDADPNTPATFDIEDAAPGNVDVPVVNGATTYYFIEYTAPQRATLLSNYLRYIRLVPSFCQPELMDNFVGGFNRTFTDYDDLVSELVPATVDDPLEGEPSNEIVGTFKFIPNQVSFSYNTRFNKIVFTGLDNRFSYVPAAADDPNWFNAAIELEARDKANTRFTFSGAVAVVSPYQPFRNLNLRLGFNYVTYPSDDNFFNMLRPIPPYITSPPINLGLFTSYDHVAPGYCDLVYSSMCHIYTDLTGGSTVSTMMPKALLASIPLNTPNLGVGFHSLPLNNPLTKISDQIYEIYIELRTDNGAPFYLGNNAIVSLEFILTY